jgi:hypothetical protein
MIVKTNHYKGCCSPGRNGEHRVGLSYGWVTLPIQRQAVPLQCRNAIFSAAPGGGFRPVARGCSPELPGGAAVGRARAQAWAPEAGGGRKRRNFSTGLDQSGRGHCRSVASRSPFLGSHQHPAVCRGRDHARDGLRFHSEFPGTRTRRDSDPRRCGEQLRRICQSGSSGNRDLNRYFLPAAPYRSS